MKASHDFDLSQILNIFYRRRGFIIAVFFVSTILAGYLAWSLPTVYRSSTLILIRPPKLPTSYIESTVTLGPEEQIRAITEQVLSRTRLEKVINELNLYPPREKRGGNLEERVAKLRKRIRLVSPNRAAPDHNKNAFEISFEDENPDKAMQVAARLASLFIEENLLMREQQAMGTTVFITEEAKRLREELEKQESQVNLYRSQHQYELPEHLDANLRTLEQFRTELQSSMLRLSSLQERKGNLEKQLAEGETIVPIVTGIVGQNIPRWQQIESRKTQLKTLLSLYKDTHPDVIRLKREIQSLKAEEAEAPMQKAKTTEMDSTSVNSARSPVQETLNRQITDSNVEIKSLQSRIGILQGQISSYQSRVEGTPLRSIELSKIMRTYDITLKKYQDLLAKSMEAQLSENMEKKQKGGEFQVIDPANFPQNPVRPNRPQILIIGILAGLVGGLGLAFALDNLDLTFKRSEDLDDYINVPLLAAIPAVVTRGSVLEQRRAQLTLLLASAGVAAVGVIFIRLFGASFF